MGHRNVDNLPRPRPWVFGLTRSYRQFRHPRYVDICLILNESLYVAKLQGRPLNKQMLRQSGFLPELVAKVVKRRESKESITIKKNK